MGYDAYAHREDVTRAIENWIRLAQSVGGGEVSRETRHVSADTNEAKAPGAGYGVSEGCGGYEAHRATSDERGTGPRVEGCEGFGGT